MARSVRSWSEDPNIVGSNPALDIFLFCFILVGIGRGRDET